MHTNARDWLACVWVLVACACSDVEITIPQEKATFNARVALEGTVCAPNDYVEPVPYKVLFVIDTSGSNDWTDNPADNGGRSRREEAVHELIQANINNPNVFFGIITFGDEPERRTYGFTRDTTILNEKVSHVSEAMGRTNYSETIWDVIEFIRHDLELLDPVEAVRTRYIVFWVSDGEPTEGDVDANTLLSGIDHLRSMLDGKVAGINVHTAFLDGEPPPEITVQPGERENALQLLQNMATGPDDTFSDIAADEPFHFVFEPLPIRGRFELAAVVAYNRHTRFGEDLPEPDTDGDGLSDTEEGEWGSEFSLADADGDGYNDAIEAFWIGGLQPDSFDAGCDNAEVDTDFDGLNDCEEIALGLSRFRPDTDGDHISDFVEVMMRGSPFDADPSMDSDLDGMPDSLEVRFHLDPRTGTSPGMAERWGYEYQLLSTERTQVAAPLAPQEGALLEPDDELGNTTLCYALKVDNIAVYETQETHTNRKGYNSIVLDLAFKPQDGRVSTLFLRGEFPVHFQLPDTLEPATGKITFTPDSFTPLYETETGGVE